MRFTTFTFASVALATAALAAPAPEWKPQNSWRGNGYGGWGKHRQKSYTGDGSNSTTPEAPTCNTTNPTTPTNPPTPSFCVSDEQASAGAEIFRQLIQAYSDELALEALTEDFIDYSSAVNIIRNRGNPGPFTVNEATFVGRQAFMDAQGSQPQIPFDTLDTVHGCDSITTRWQTLRSANGQATESNNIPVVGLGLLKVVPDSENSYGFRVQTLYSEFNAAAWLVNNGVFTPQPVTTSANAAPVAAATPAPGSSAPVVPAQPPQKRDYPYVGMI